ncbi:FtsX-like permease family protein [Aliikangiella marina]|uniref:FtsX-like permease family protein n=1 Tax=Aliikangiella marina TaxID=1712262 RepID=A0A545TCN6_9GAMM|nr:FtsX-like permease family protein [Aliikangiella marina]TQV74977.1 FtsX-like permease family protein [Aliikangiella marina]
MIVSLAWRNIWRQPRRTLLSAIAVMLTCGLLVFLPALQIGSYQAMVDAAIGIIDGTAQIQKSAYLDSPSMRTSFLPKDELYQTVKQEIPDSQLAKRGNSFALVSSEERSYGLQIIGVEPEKEKLISTIPKNIKQGRYLSAEVTSESVNEIILGSVLAKNLQLKVGDKVTLLGTGKDGSLAADSLQLIGIFSSGIKELDRQLAQMHYERFSETFSMENQVHALVLINGEKSLMRSYPDSLKRYLQERDLVLRDWQALQPDIVDAIKLDISSALAMYIILILVIVFSLLNSSLMSVLERTREFGMMMALGVKANLLGKIIWVESIFVMLLGVCSGLIIGAVVTYYYQVTGITFTGADVVFEQFGLDPTIYPLLNAISLLVGPLVIGLCLAIAGAYPGFRIHRLEIIPAMRSV